MGKTILIVEEEAIVALDMDMTLTELGHRVFIAVDASGAERALNEQRIDAALLDWRGDSSTPLGEMFRQHAIPFALCSSATFSELAEIFRDVPLISKPFTASELVKAVEGLAPTFQGRAESNSRIEATSEGQL